MKIYFLIPVLLISSIVLSQPQKQKTEIIITKTTPYCGGDNPPKHILDEAQKKKIPFGEKFYIIKGSYNTIHRKILYTLVFDSSGKKHVMLQPGRYSIINHFGFNRIDADTTQFDLNCLMQEWKKPLFIFEVQKGKRKTFSYNIVEVCAHNMPCRKGNMSPPM